MKQSEDRNGSLLDQVSHGIATLAVNVPVLSTPFGDYSLLSKEGLILFGSALRHMQKMKCLLSRLAFHSQMLMKQFFQIFTLQKVE